MLILKNIRKEYTAKDAEKSPAGINIDFRDSELVSILGPPGSGNETMLGIIGGLERYNSGDMSINGKSTMEFSDRDWDAYRSNSVGFMLQSLPLIPHETVLANVELSLALSGISKSKRRMKASAALKKAGLYDGLSNKPGKLSAYEILRTKLARAFVNNPDIILSDEPEENPQIMKILKEVSKDKLVILFANNEKLAENYSTRVIKIQSSTVSYDSNPYHVVVEKPLKIKRKRKKEKRPSLSLLYALQLSWNSLMSKKRLTFLRVLAGSIGIMGIILISAFSEDALEGMTKIRSIFTGIPAILLVVSSVMISIGTYFSVTLRTNEIVILRSLGASRRNIFRVFNAETFIVGLSSDVLGIITSAVLTIPYHLARRKTTGILNIVSFPASAYILLVFISVILNFMAGLIPSIIAAEKDPAEELRSG